MKHYLLFALLALLPFAAVSAAEREVTITSAQWAVPRDGAQILKLKGLDALMQRLDTHPGAHLQIRYPGGDAGTLWARELKAWLVALGLGSDRIEMVPGSARGDAVTLTLQGAGSQ